jgi:hypothetical protein
LIVLVQNAFDYAAMLDRGHKDRIAKIKLVPGKEGDAQCVHRCSRCLKVNCSWQLGDEFFLGQDARIFRGRGTIHSGDKRQGDDSHNQATIPPELSEPLAHIEPLFGAVGR